MVKNIKVVIGANYGDEGKGLMTSYFAREAYKRGDKTLNVLTNGGAQRGHTVDFPDGSHFVFHHFGSGSPYGAITYLPDEFILNPMQFVKEDDELSRRGIPHKAIIEGKNMWSTPYDMIFNQLEALVGAKHNTCGMGIWNTVDRYKRDTRIPPHFKEFTKMSYSTQVEILKDIKAYYDGRLRDTNYFGYGTKFMGNEMGRVYESQNLMDHFILDCMRMDIKTGVIPFYGIDNFYDTIIFENAQGLLLDQDIKGQEEYTTPSKTGFCGVAKKLNRLTRHDSLLRGIDMLYGAEVCYVSRSYITRHGDGDFIHDGDLNIKSEYENNVYNCFQGAFRRGLFDDIDTVIDRTDKDFQRGLDVLYPEDRDKFKKTLAITHVNECDTNTEAANYISNSPINICFNNKVTI